MNSIRQLCAELVEKLAQYDSADPYHDCASLLERARAALAELGERIGEAEVFQIYDNAYVAETHLAENHSNNEGIEWNEDAVDARANRAGLRAVLARFGTTSAPPDEGEAAELAARIRQVPTFEEAWKQLGYQYGADALECVRLGWDLRSDCDAPPRPVPNQPPGRQGLTWEDAIQGLKHVLTDQSEDAISSAWQRSRILDAIDLMEANSPPRADRAEAGE